MVRKISRTKPRENSEVMRNTKLWSTEQHTIRNDYNMIQKLTCKIPKSNKVMYFSSSFHFLSQLWTCRRIHEHKQIKPNFPGFFGKNAADCAIIPRAVNGISYVNITGKKLTIYGGTSTADQIVEFCITAGNGSCPLFKWPEVASTRDAASKTVK